MPAMPRWNKKAQKIVYDLLGKPENMVDHETKKTKKIKKKLLFDDSEWSR